MIAFWLFVYTVMGKDAQRLLWVCPPNLHPPNSNIPQLTPNTGEDMLEAG